MHNCQAYYDSDEGIGFGPISFREEMDLLKHNQHMCTTKTRRETTSGRLENVFPNKSNSTEYLTATDTSAQTNMAADSSLEDGNRSIKEAVGNIIEILDNDESADEILNDSVVFISDEDCAEDSIEEKDVISIVSSSCSSASSEETQTTPLRKSIPKFKINSPTSNLRQPSVLNVSAHNSPTVRTSGIMSDTRLLQDLSAALHLFTRKDSLGIPTDEESLFLRSEREDAFADDEGEECGDVNDSLSFETAKDVPANAENHSESNDADMEKGVGVIDNAKFERENISTIKTNSGEIVESIATTFKTADFVDNKQQELENMIHFQSINKTINNIETNDNNEFNSTLDRIDFILNFGSQSNSKELETPQSIVLPRLSKSAPSTPNAECISTPISSKGGPAFKVPTKIPCSMKKEIRTPRSRFANIKSPVAHYIKNSPYAPIIRNEPCKVVPMNQLLAMVSMESPSIKPNIVWPSITLTEKFYKPGVAHIVPDHKTKILKLPSNIEAITMNMGVMKRHLSHQGMSSRLPVPQSKFASDDLHLHDTLIAQNTPRRDVSLITQNKITID